MASDEHDRAVAALIGRVAGMAGVHVYEMELFPDGDYVCHVWLGGALDALLGGLPEGMDEEAAWEACIHADDREVYDDTAPALLRLEPTDVEYRLVGFDGVTRWVWERCRPRRTDDGRVLVDGIVTEITDRRLAQDELAAARDRLAHMAYHDPLTGLPNRTLFEEHLEVAVERSRREGTSLVVLFLDMDGFKRVNDLHGHEVGDHLLRVTGERLRALARRSDVVARMAGDEFLMLAEVDATPTAGEAMAARVEAALAEPVALADRTLHPQVSAGYCRFPEDAGDPSELLRLADAEMYRRKRGRAA
jgi:diguanylate cyclase (GGDEF)-like protein